MRTGLLVMAVMVLMARPALASNPQITFVGECHAASTVCTPPTHKIGDLFLAWTFRAALTAPTLPAGWTSVATASTGASSMRLACKVATTSSETATGFTNANVLNVVIYRNQAAAVTSNCNSAALGGTTNNVVTSGTVVSYDTITMSVSDSSSWVVGCASSKAGITNLNSPPTGMTNRSNQGGQAACQDTNGGVSSWSTQTITANATGVERRVIVIEIKAACAAAATFCMLQHLISHNSASANTVACTLLREANTSTVIFVGTGVNTSASAGNNVVTGVADNGTGGSSAFTFGTASNTFNAGSKIGVEGWYTLSVLHAATTIVTVTFTNTNTDDKYCMIEEVSGFTTPTFDLANTVQGTSSGGIDTGASITTTGPGVVMAATMNIGTIGGVHAGNEFGFLDTLNGNSGSGVLNTTASTHQPVWDDSSAAAFVGTTWALKETPGGCGGWWNGWGPGDAWLLPPADALPWRRSSKRYIVTYHKGRETRWVEAHYHDVSGARAEISGGMGFF